MANWRFPPQMPFSWDPVLWSPGSLANSWFTNLFLYTKGKGRSKKEADHCRLIGGSFNQQGNLQELYWLATRWLDRRTHLPSLYNLKFYIELLTGFSHVYHPDGLNNTLLWRLCLWNRMWEWWVEYVFQGQRNEWGASDCPDPAEGSIRSFTISITSSKSV